MAQLGIARFFKKTSRDDASVGDPRACTPAKKPRKSPPEKGSEYKMTTTKIETWKKKYCFWETPSGKPLAEDPQKKKKCWIEFDLEKAEFTCFVCRQYPSLANNENSVTKGSKLWHVNVVNRHETDPKHDKCLKKYLRELFSEHPSDLEKSVLIAKKRLSLNKQLQLSALFNTSYYIAKEGLSFRKFPSLCKLQSKNGIKLGENYLTDKSCRMFVGVNARYLHQSLADNVNKVRSVLCDGSTDVSIVEQEAVYLRYVKNGYPKTKFVGIENPVRPNAANITESIENALSTFATPQSEDTEENYINGVYKKIINANFDGASVMSGHVSGVRARMAEKQPGLVFTHCVAHRLELAVLDAIKSEEYLQKFSDLINDIFQFYYQSPVRRRQFKDLAEVLEEF
ncbi:Hypothetical predicted protein [Paramuricea clavata]|uniref:Uncharacterized protein n=1 Tax=Paramuricea clavata TaxID=317549 RepID=A0A7D9HMV7_PARCT|nr:Hypothetical predicted protein [Paramuricea clavata]